MNRHKNVTLGLMVLIVLTAFLLRVHRLGRDASFTTDEVTTVTSSMGSFAELWEQQSGTPLQALWIRFGAQILGLGYSEFGVHFMSVLTGMLAVALAYFLGKLLFGERIGLLTAFFLAFSAYHIYWSRSARYYSMMVFLSLAAFLCLYRALETNQWWAWVGYALFRTLSLYDHLTAVWILAGEGVFALAYLLVSSWQRFRQLQSGRRVPGEPVQLWQGIKDRLRSSNPRRVLFTSKLFWFVLAIGIILLAYAPRWFPLARDVFLGNSWFRIGGISSEQVLLETPRYSQPKPVLGGGWRGPLLVLNVLNAWITPLHIMMLLGFVGGVFFCAWRRQWRSLLFVLTLIVTPFVVMSVGKSFLIVVNGRYLISILPLYLLMAGRGFSGLSELLAQALHLRDRWIAYTSWAVLTVVALVYAGLSYTRIPLTYRNTGQNWRVVGEFLSQVVQPEEKIVVHGNPKSAVALQFYMPEFNVIERDPRLSYDAIFEGQERAWLVFHPGTNMYMYPKDWTDQNKGIALIFRGAWYPDIERNTELAPAQNWDLYAVQTSPSITSTEQALEMHHAWLAKAEARNPDDVRRHLTLAEAYQRFDRCDLAVIEYDQALHEGYVNNQLASYIYDARAICWHRLDSVERAIADWHQAIERAKWSAKPYEHLGQAYIQLDRLEQAQVIYQNGVAANPDAAWPHILLGDLYLRMDSPEKAEAKYRQAITVEPDERTGYQRLIRMYADQKEHARVLAILKQAKERNPWFGWPHYNLGNYYRRLGRGVDAIAEYRRAVELQPEYASIVSISEASWDLASTLNLVHTYSDEVDLLWWPGNTWVKPRPDAQVRLVGRSMLTVQGQVQPGQLSLHPFSDHQKTYIEFDIPDNPFVDLQVGFALADEVAEQSNGVGYTIEVKTDGDAEWQALFQQEVAQNVWQEHTISLLPFWNDDLSFRLAVDALGDDAYDLLQSTVKLIPALEVWDLSAHLEESQFIAESISLEWQGDGFYRADGQRLVGRSELPVKGRSMPGQVMFHPFDSGTASTLLFSLEGSPYRVLKTSFGLADQVLSRSDGVDYTVSVSIDGGASFEDLIHTTVTGDALGSEMVALPVSQDLVLKLTSSARKTATFDWLQVSLVLLPLEDDQTIPELTQPGELMP